MVFMRGWFHILLQIGAIIALLSGAVQAQAACAGGETPARQGMATDDAGYQGGVIVHHEPPMNYGMMTDHPMGSAICKHLCGAAAIAPASAQGLMIKPTKAASLRLSDDILFPSLRPDPAERPPKSRV